MLLSRTALALTGALFAAVAPPADAAQNWHSFRGPNGSGVVEGVGPPAGLDREPAWRLGVPVGHSSPVIADGAAFVTGFSGGRLFTVSVDLATGWMRWRRAAPIVVEAPPDKLGVAAAPTPVTDGRRVFIYFPAFGLLAYDVGGDELWRLPLAPLEHPWGAVSSPILVDDKLVLACDHDGESFLLAVDASSGAPAWRTPRPHATHGFSTPIVHRPPAGPAEILVSGAYRVSGYAVDTGEERWWVDGMAWKAKSTPVLGDGVVYVNSWVPSPSDVGAQPLEMSWDAALAAHDEDGDGRVSAREADELGLEQLWYLYDLDEDKTLDQREWSLGASHARAGNGLFAIRLGGLGDLTETHVLWKHDRALPLYASPLWLDGVLWVARAGGLLTALDARTGEVLRRARVDGVRSRLYASPVASGGRLLLADQDGAFALVHASAEELARDEDDWTVECRGELEEIVCATPALGPGYVLVRTQDTLMLFGEPPRTEGPDHLPDPGDPTLAFVGVDVVPMDSERVLRDQTVLVRGDRIEALGPRAEVEVPGDARRVAGGGTLVPGLVDAYVSVEDAFELARYVAAGVTSIRCFDGRPELLDMRSRAERGELVAPRWTIGGPLLRWTEGAAEARAEVDRQRAAGYDFVSAHRETDPDVWRAMVARAEQIGMPVAGPIPKAVPREEALTAPLWSIDRVESLLGDYVSRESGHVAPDLPTPADAARDVRAQALPVTPVLAGYAWLLDAIPHRKERVTEQAIELVAPVAREKWAGGGHAVRRKLTKTELPVLHRAFGWQRRVVRELDDGSVLLLVGTDAMTSFVHPGTSLHQELSLLVGCGLSPYRALRAATANAGALFRDGRGTIRVGARADLVLVDGDPLSDLACLAHPRGVVVGGRWHAAEELTAELERARAIYADEAPFVRLAAGTGTAAALAHAAERDASEPGRLVVRPDALNRLCELFNLRGVRRTEDAADLARFGLERWPAAWWAHLRIAEARYWEGRVDEARDACELSLAARPDGIAARRLAQWIDAASCANEEAER